MGQSSPICRPLSRGRLTTGTPSIEERVREAARSAVRQWQRWAGAGPSPRGTCSGWKARGPPCRSTCWGAALSCVQAPLGLMEAEWVKEEAERLGVGEGG